MEGSDEDRIFKFISIVEGKLSKQEQKIRHIGSEIAKGGQVDLKNTQVRLVVKFMDYYFEQMQSDTVKTIMSELVTAGPKQTQEEVMKVIFKNTGPGLGKVLQQIGKEKGVGETFSAMLAILESTGKKVPIHLVQELVSRDVGGYELKNIIEKPLGTGTMAQVNRATLLENGTEKEVALRFLKPGIANRCKEDIEILRKFVPENEDFLRKEGFQDLHVVTTMINSVERFLNEELDFKIAIANQQKAYEVYTKSVILKTDSKYSMLEMKVPQIFAPPAGTSNLHIQEFASGGAKFSELADEGAKKVVAQEMVRMWFEEALFESGFLNADLHQGNFRVVLVEENDKIKILLYDFGLSTTLSKEEQRAFLLLGAGAYLKSPSTIADGLMVSMNSTDGTLRKKLLKDIEQEMKLKPSKPAEDWIAWCVAKNYFVSEKLGAFARGSLLLKQLPQSMGQTELFKDTVLKSAKSHLVKSITDRKYDFPLRKMDIAKIAAIQVKNSCSDLLKSFFHFFSK
jgi:predicted unusual protein kinase regulating ubiquinone biosynthesis (AarF/ABC1/UbiB family)